jgi:hypothetical protein
MAKEVPPHWRAEYPGGGFGMFRAADIRAYDLECDATPVAQSGGRGMRRRQIARLLRRT